MAKPFEERLATALKTDRSNSETLRELIAETQAELARQQEIQSQAEAESVDVTLNGSERDDAAEAAGRARRLATGYADAIGKLQAKLAAKQESERRRRELEEKAAAEAERDELAARFSVEVPDAIKQLTSLFLEIEANESRLQAAGSLGRDAEAQARDVPGNYFSSAGPIDRFTKMKIPAWSGPGRAWPLDPGVQERVRTAEQHRRQRLEYLEGKSPEAQLAAAEARASEEARWTPCRVFHHRNALIGGVEHRRGKASIDSRQPMFADTVLEMTAEQMQAARAKGLTVEPVTAEEVAK